MINRIIHNYILFGLALIAIASSCSDTIHISEDVENSISAGEQVLFSACVPQPERTRVSTETEYNSLIAKFQSVRDLYTFNVKMLTDNAGSPNVEGMTDLVPVTETDENNVLTFDPNGFLKLADNATPLYWQSNNTPYAFEATSHMPAGATVATNQSTAELYFAEDYIKGYGYVKAWDAETTNSKYDLDAPNYLTAKQWYAANQALGLPQGLSTDYYKTIPLYMQHQRARISIILRADEGVDREHLQYDIEHGITTASDKVHMKIFSYKDDIPTEVNPLLSGKQITYNDRDGDVQYMTACYDAIVEPHDYADHASDHKIAAIEVSNQKFSFYAANDTKYGEYLNEEDEAEKESLLTDVKSRYKLNAGDHLVIDVTLSTGDRKILITAYVVDWEDWPFVTKCDDYGHASEPISINNRKDLIEFLQSEELNRPGNIAFISPVSINLEAQGSSEDTYPDNWNEITQIADKELKATLSLAGATLKVNHTLFPGGIASSGSIVNGTLEFGNGEASNDIVCAIAPTNEGSIERINVTNIKGSQIKATHGGLVNANLGNILRCTSNMPVFAADQSSDYYIGGIAGTSLFPRDTEGHAITTTMPVIDMCTVNARVSGGEHVYGGGIVGQAEGKITNNTFEYGITLLQNPKCFKNIIAAKGATEGNLYNADNVSGNQWPTSVNNAFTETDYFTNARTGSSLYHYVLDSEEELKELITKSAYNSNTNRARLSNDFTVLNENWKIEQSGQQVSIGQQSEDLTTSGIGNVFCELDGNNCSVYLDGTSQAPMLFSNIVSYVHDLTIVCLKDIKSEQNHDLTDAIAPLAYSVSAGRLFGIKVKMASDKYVQASNPSGLVVCAYNGTTIEDCESNAKLKIELNTIGGQASYFVGGIVNTADVAKISRCTYHGRADAIIPSTDGTIYYGGIVGGATNKNRVPEIEISDCTSWLSWTNTNEDQHPNWGGIIGYAVYGTGSHLENAMKNCQGNWWQALNAAGQIQTGKTEEDIIGRKNSIAPLEDSNYGNY